MTSQWTSSGTGCPILELHEFRAERGRAEALAGLIGDDLAPALAAEGATTLGVFRVAGDSAKLMWVRGYADLAQRRQALEAFFASSGWAGARRFVAESAREQSVRLVRSLTDPQKPASGPRRGTPLVALVSELRFAEQIGNYHLWLRLLLRKAGMDPIASYATLESANDVPAVPVRRHLSEHVALMRAGGSVPALPRELAGMLRQPAETLRLEPAGVLLRAAE